MEQQGGERGHEPGAHRLHFLSVAMPTRVMPILRTSSSTATTVLKSAFESPLITTRGSLVDEQALVDALEAGRLAGAGLDVFADEPHVPEALITRDDVVLLPHLASGTVETRSAMVDLVLANVDSFLAHGHLVDSTGRTGRRGILGWSAS